MKNLKGLVFILSALVGALLFSSSSFAATTYYCQFDPQRKIIVSYSDAGKAATFEYVYQGQYMGQSMIYFDVTIKTSGNVTSLSRPFGPIIDVAKEDTGVFITFYVNLKFVDPTGMKLACK